MAIRFHYALALICGLLLTAELLFLPGPGIQADEALFVVPYLRNNPPVYSWDIGGVHVPAMAMDYVGALKSWLYWPLFRIWPPGVWSIRLPVCLLSLVTLTLFATVIRKTCGERVALWAALLLATDAPFLLANVFDWGPVSLLLLGTALWLVLIERFAAAQRTRYLAWASFAAGVAMWSKAIFVVPLLASSLAIAVVYRDRLRELLTPRRAAAAAVLFCAGCAPLIEFNLTHAGATARASAYLDRTSTSAKFLMLRRTLDGRALEHFLVKSAPAERIPLQGAPLEQLVKTWYAGTSFQPGSLLIWALLASLCALPLLRPSALFRILLCVWIGLFAAVGLMWAVRNAGAGPHHTVLVDPAPQWIVAATAVALGERFRRASLAPLLAGVVLVSNVWLLAQYQAAASRNGFSVFWSDGVGAVGRVALVRGLPVAFLDWGIQNGVQIETRDRLRVVSDSPPRPGVLYITHCDGFVLEAERAREFQSRADVAGLTAERNRIVADSRGAPMFCTFELAADQKDRPAK